MENEMKIKINNNFGISNEEIKSNDTYNNSNSKDLYNYKSQSNKNTLLKTNQLDKNEVVSLFKDQKSQNIHLSDNYNKELYNKYFLFLKSKKFKISNEFDAKNSKKFLNKKDKYMQKMVLSDIIEKDEKNKDNNNDEKEQKIKPRRSGNYNNVSNFCIIVSDYDDASKNEVKYNYSVKLAPRKIDNMKKNKNLSKYFINNNLSKSKTKYSEPSNKSD